MKLLIIAASALGFSFRVRARTEMKIWCVVGMHMLRVVGNEYNLGVKGLNADCIQNPFMVTLVSPEG